MEKWIFTFGSSQLKELKDKMDSMKTCLIVEGVNEQEARNKVLNSFIGKNFCTSYPYEHIDIFRKKREVSETTLGELEALMKEDRKKFSKEDLNIVLNDNHIDVSIHIDGAKVSHSYHKNIWTEAEVIEDFLIYLNEERVHAEC